MNECSHVSLLASKYQCVPSVSTYCVVGVRLSVCPCDFHFVSTAGLGGGESYGLDIRRAT